MSLSRLGNKSNTTTTTSTNQACAACKYQRRKCTPDCLLAPYFPHDLHKQFLNAHKLFGVSNITKIIKNLNPPERDEAMKTIMFQADARALDPVGGCYRIVLDLQRQVEYRKLELELVLHQLAICRAQAGQNIDQLQHQPVQESQSLSQPGNALDGYDQMLFHYECLGQEHHHHHNQENLSAFTAPMQDSSVASSPASFQIDNSYVNSNEEQARRGVDDVKQFLDVNDVKFELDELVDKRFVPSTELVMSS